MNIVINEELRAYIDPLTANEYAALERSILAEGCRDALVLWGDMLIDGHNRYAICQKHGVEFKTVQNAKFSTLDDVQLWMIDNHLARRSVSDFQRGVLALRKKEIISARAGALQENAPAAVLENADAASGAPAPARLNTREDLARAAGISSNTIGQIEKITKTAAPELVAAVRAGTISINAAAAVASLPTSEQAAAVAGGRKELQQAAKLVREMKASGKPPKPAKEQGDAVVELDSDAVVEVGGHGGADVALLNRKISELAAENTALKEQVAMLTAALEDARKAA
jgi:ParB-like chromosome segregation protein Spo0J